MAFRVLTAGVILSLSLGGAALADPAAGASDSTSGLTRLEGMANAEATIAGAKVYARDGRRLGDVEMVAFDADGAPLGVLVTPFVFASAAAEEAPQAPGAEGPAAPQTDMVFALKASRVFYDARSGIVMADAASGDLEKLAADAALPALLEAQQADLASET